MPGVNRWIPARVYFYGFDHIVSKFLLRNGAWVFYLPKRWSTPFMFVIIIDHKLVKELEPYLRETTVNGRCENAEGAHGVVREYRPGRCEFIAYALPVSMLNGGVYVVRVNPDRRSIEILKPNRPTTPRYNVVLLLRDYWSTNATKKYPSRVEPKPVVRATSSSATGAHWTEVFVWILGSNERAIIEEYRLTGRGNAYKYLVEVSPEGGVVVRRSPPGYTNHKPLGEEYVVECRMTPSFPVCH